MSNPITDLLTGGLSGIVGSVTGILDKFITNPEEKLKASLQVAQMSHDLQLQVLSAEKDLAAQQGAVIVAEASSDSWLTKSWRPITMLVMLGMVVWHTVILATIAAFYPQIHVTPVDPEAWALLKLGIGGYIGARTLEKTIPQVVEAIKK